MSDIALGHERLLSEGSPAQRKWKSCRSFKSPQGPVFQGLFPLFPGDFAMDLFDEVRQIDVHRADVLAGQAIQAVLDDGPGIGPAV